MEFDEEVKVNDLLESPDYIGRVIAVDDDFIRMHILHIKPNSFISMADFLRNHDHTRPEEQIARNSGYFLNDIKLLNVNWKDWLRLHGLLNA